MKSLKTHPDLEAMGFRNLRQIFWQLSTPQLYEQAVQRQEAQIAHLGPLVVRTGVHTGRSPGDKFVVRRPEYEENIWWGKVNQPFESARFDALLERVIAHFSGKDAYVQNCFGGADHAHRLPVRVITEFAWHALFARNMFIRARPEELKSLVPEFTLIFAPTFEAILERDGTKSGTFIILDFTKKIVLIGGTSYAGEMKKSVFTILNYLLPGKGILPMHCSANEGKTGDTALFFGLSGTGKTTLSADPSRTLIGDDEHGWSDTGVFNFEGGCYAKVIHLSPTGEPEIYETTRRFGTVLENVVMDDDSRFLDLNDASFTENTRACYPIEFIPNATITGMGKHPKNIIFLTADAFGVMPPVARLTPEQAMYHFLSGYTAKVAGTEKGLGSEPQATFSTCFGAPFLPMHPRVYARLLGEKMKTHAVNAWLVNTGWTGGPFGTGKRMNLSYTRAMVHAILDGSLAKVSTTLDPVFGVQVPEHCPEVPDEVLNQRGTWADPVGYDAAAVRLAGLFADNFKQYSDEVDAAVVAAAPVIEAS